MNVQDRQRLIACERRIEQLEAIVSQLRQSLVEVSRSRGSDTPDTPQIDTSRETIGQKKAGK